MESVYTHKGQRSGDSGAESYQRDVEACKNIFVPWAWLVGILVGLFGIYGATLYFYVQHEDSQEARLDKGNDGINQAKSDIANGFNALNKRFDDFEKRNDKRLERIENKIDRTK